MRVDPAIPRCEKCTLVIEAIGGDKVRVNHQSLDTPLVILANQALEVVGIGKQLHIARALRPAEYFNVDLTLVTVRKPSRGQCNSVTNTVTLLQARLWRSHRHGNAFANRGSAGGSGGLSKSNSVSRRSISWSRASTSLSAPTAPRLGRQCVIRVDP